MQGQDKLEKEFDFDCLICLLNIIVKYREEKSLMRRRFFQVAFDSTHSLVQLLIGHGNKLRHYCFPYLGAAPALRLCSID